MFNWLRELYEIRATYRKVEVCESCEALKQMNDHLRMDNEKLLRRILEPKVEPERIVAPEPMVPIHRNVPWRVKQQMLEAEDRQKANALRQAAKPDNSIEALEKDLDLAAKERENEAATGINK